MKLAYFDCFSGVSGDMILGALVDLGVPAGWIDEQVRRLAVSGFTLTAETVFKHHIAGTKVRVAIQDEGVSRTWADIRRLLDAGDLPEPVREKSLAVFARLAGAEAEIHGCPVDDVHFHEVGGTDAIVDVVGSVAGLERLGAERIVCSALPLGKGFAGCRHGKIPVPAPATERLLQEVPVYGAGIEAELVTPTGAAVITALADAFGDLPAMRVEKSGYGAGSADFDDRPNLLRVLVGSDAAAAGQGADETVAVLEAAVDDMNPELFGYLMERLFAEGALDVLWMPAYMKKNRPGTRLEAVCAPEAAERLLAVLLAESTTTGVRHRHTARRALPRRPVVVDTDYGPVRAKQIRLVGGGFRVTPEYEDCRRIARAKGVSIQALYDAVARGRPRGEKGAVENGRPESV